MATLTLEQAGTFLRSTKSSERRRGATAIGAQRYTTLADDLLNAYLKERKDERTWETQCAMIEALGILDHKPALEPIKELLREGWVHDMKTTRAATAYVRLLRTSLSDAQPVLLLVQRGTFSMISGALEALGLDRMMPPEDHIVELLQLGHDLHEHKDRSRGFGDLRRGLAAACAGWDIRLTRSFLEHCAATGEVPTQHIAAQALLGKYVSPR